MITSCTWPWRRWLAAMASSVASRSARDSPIPTRSPVVNGMPATPGRLERGQPPVRGLVGSRAVGGQVGVDRLDHHPLAGRDRPEPDQVLGVEGAGVGVGQQAGLLDHGPARRLQVVDGGGVAVVVQPLAGHRVAVLGCLAQGEEGLVAAGGPAGPGDVEHLVDREVGRLQPGRGLGEGAVAAAVAAQHGQGDEHLGREGDPVAVGLVDAPGRPAPAGRPAAER